MAVTAFGLRRRYHRRVKRGACLAIIGILLAGGLVCLCCATTASDICCRSLETDGSKIASVISARSEDRGCCEQKHRESRKRCCLGRSEPNSQATLSQLIDLRPGASDSDRRLQLCEPGQPSEVTARPLVMNRGSTHLLCCVIRI